MVQINSENQRICFTLRQWSLVLAILAFIVTAFLTFGAILGLKHTRNAWEFVLADLAEEESNSVYDDRRQIKANQMLLHQSQHIVQVLIFLLDIGTISGCLNQVACGLMVYGIAVRSPKCILPWIVVSGVTYMLVLSVVFVSYFELVPGIYVSLNELIAGLSVSSVFILIWYTMLLYYYYLLRPSCSMRSITPKIIKSYGGYLHKVDSTKVDQKVVV